MINSSDMKVIEDLYTSLVVKPIYISKAEFRKLNFALSSIEELAYRDTTPAELRENLIAVLAVVYPRILTND